MPEHGYQEFEGYGQIWHVEVAMRYVADRQPETLVIDEKLADDARFMTSGEPIANRDLSDPVLVIPLPEGVFGPSPGHLVIDGWHRIAQAVVEGVSELPAHFLSADEERACRAADEWDSELVEVFRESHEPWHAVRTSN